MQHFIEVENIKCGGCASGIVSKLSAINGVKQVEVDVDSGLVKFEAEESLLAQIKKTLLSMGYPETGSVEGLAAAGAKAKSFVSCAIGKVTKN